MKTLIFVMLILTPMVISTQTPPIEPGVSQELARWRAARYSDVRYKLNLTLEKMSPVLKGTIEIRLRVRAGDGEKASGGEKAETRPVGSVPPIILDWRKIRGHEDKSTILSVTVNGKEGYVPPAEPIEHFRAKYARVDEQDEHLIFRDGVVAGENVIKLDFTSPILTSGSAITRYVDKEDGSEYIYSLFVPSDASTAFPVFDQPDIKARFSVEIDRPSRWNVISNSRIDCEVANETYPNQADLFRKRFLGNLLKERATKDRIREAERCLEHFPEKGGTGYTSFFETKPISTYVFAFAAGPWEKVSTAGEKRGNLSGSEGVSSSLASKRYTLPTGRVSASMSEPRAVATGFRETPGVKNPVATAPGSDKMAEPTTDIYVRKSQAAKFKPHAAEIFRLNREAVKYFEQYFDYKFPFPKYDLVLIPEFPFGGMEHAGATFLRESAIIFPQEPTKNDHISRATLIFHEAAHQWFGDTVTMRWFDDLWLKEGFATFTAYKAMERIMPEMNAWKVFYERIKQGAYQTDSTRGTTAIYQPIANLSAAKSAYGNIVYNKAPAFLRQAEFYLGEDKFQTAVRAFLKKHEFGNAGWEDLVREFEAASPKNTGLTSIPTGIPIGEEWTTWGETWVKQPGLATIRTFGDGLDPRLFDAPKDAKNVQMIQYVPSDPPSSSDFRRLPNKFKTLILFADGSSEVRNQEFHLTGKSNPAGGVSIFVVSYFYDKPKIRFVFPNYGDYGYGIFLLDEKSRDYVLKNIQNEKDPFLRTMMWGALWDGVREGELDPRVFVELVVKVLGSSPAGKENHPVAPTNTGATPLLRKEGSQEGEDESTIATLLGRTGTALNYYIEDAERVSSPRVSKGSDGPSGSQAPSLTVGLRTQPAASPTTDLRTRVEDLLIERMRNAPTLGQRITFYRAFLNIAVSERARGVLKEMLKSEPPPSGGGQKVGAGSTNWPPANAGGSDLPLKTKDRFDIVTRLLILNDPEAPKLLAGLEKTETSDDAKRYAYAARAGIGTAENKTKYWNDFVSNKEISESWIEAAFGPWNSIRHSELTLPYLERALRELPNHKRNRKIFFVNGWLGAFIGGQRSEEALGVVNKFLVDNPKLDNDLRLKILENVDVIERAVRIRGKN